MLFIFDNIFENNRFKINITQQFYVFFKNTFNQRVMAAAIGNQIPRLCQA